MDEPSLNMNKLKSIGLVEHRCFNSIVVIPVYIVGCDGRRIKQCPKINRRSTETSPSSPPERVISNLHQCPVCPVINCKTAWKCSNRLLSWIESHKCLATALGRKKRGGIHLSLFRTSGSRVGFFFFLL